MVDTTPPAITVPDNLILEASKPEGSTVRYNVTANDSIDGIVQVFCTPRSDSIFPIGKNKVNCQSSDKAGNVEKVSFIVKIVDTTPPDSKIDFKRVGWWGNINSSTNSTSSNEVNFEVSGVDKVGLKHIECKIDKGKWNVAPLDNINGKSKCKYTNLTDGVHVFQTRTIDKYGNFDNSPATFSWSVLSVKEALQNIVNLITLNQYDKDGILLPITETLDLHKKSDRDISCYNIDSFLENIMELYIKKDIGVTMDEKNQLILSSLSIKNRLNCKF